MSNFGNVKLIIQYQATVLIFVSHKKRIIIKENLEIYVLKTFIKNNFNLKKNPMSIFRKIVGLVLTLSFLVVFSEVKAQTILEKLKTNSQTSQFAKALEKTGTADRLKESGPFTVFAPTNSAFENLSAGQRSNNNLLLNHILTGMATERSLRAMSDITCLSGQTVSIHNQNGKNLAIESNRIIQSNIRATNGVIHIIDGVIE